MTGSCSPAAGGARRRVGHGRRLPLPPSVVAVVAVVLCRVVLVRNSDDAAPVVLVLQQPIQEAALGRLQIHRLQ